MTKPISLFESKLTELPPLQKTRKTFLEVLKISKWEVPIGNLLSYFFDPEQGHGVGKLFIESLFNTNCHGLKEHGFIGTLASNGYNLVNGKLISNSNKFELTDITDIKVVPEDATDDRKRIDILIKAKEFTVAIEFKINHLLDNPLDLYEQHVVENYCDSEKPIFFVVLTPWWKQHENKDMNNDSFKQITLSSFVQNVKLKLESSGIDLNGNYYYPLLLDFIQTVENRSRHAKMVDELSKFYDPQGDTVLSLFDQFSKEEKTHMIRGHSKDHVQSYVSVMSAIEEEIHSRLAVIKRKTTGIVTYRRINSFEGFVQIEIRDQIALKVRLSLNGWSLEYWNKVEGKGFSGRSEVLPKTFGYGTSTATILIKLEQERSKYLLEV